MTIYTPRCLAGTVICICLVAAACSSVPRGKSSGRIGVSETTEAESRSEKILPVALVEFTDQAPRRLVAKLHRLPRIRNTAGRATVILGDINNQTRIVGTAEFEFAARRLRNNLLNSEVARNKMRFVEWRKRMARLARKERVARDGMRADPPDYDPATTYALNLDVFLINRGDTNYYYMEAQLVHFDTNEIVFSDRIDVKQIKAD